jgi:hypothetical protein
MLSGFVLRSKFFVTNAVSVDSFPDWADVLGPAIAHPPSIQPVHLFKFTCDGIYVCVHLLRVRIDISL